MKTKRTVFHVVYDRERKLWVAKVRGVVVDVDSRKIAVTHRTHRMARIIWRYNVDSQSQIIIHTRDGKIAKEYTYGNDPKRSKG